MYDFLPSTRFLCEKVEQREKSKKVEQMATLYKSLKENNIRNKKLVETGML